MLTTFIAKTDSSCLIDGKAYADLPLLMTSTGILEAQSDYLRELAVTRGLSPTTVNEIGKYLRTHVHIMDAVGHSWEQTNEVGLRRWRNELAGEKPSNARRKYLNQQLAAIYHFLIWAEKKGRIQGVVGPLSPADTSTFLVPVEIAKWHSDGTPAQFKLPLLYRTVGESDQRNATAREVDELFVALANEQNPYLAERNSLIGRFAENALMRRHEISALLSSQLPSLAAAYVACSRGEELTIELHITKGMKARETIVDPQIVIDTWAFINTKRSEMLKRMSLPDRPDLPIFLSWRTGKRIHVDTLTNLFSSKQQQANIKRASLHNLRSKGATDRVESLIDMYEQTGAPLPDEETLLLQAQEILGHASIATTRKYIRREKKRQLDRKRAEHKQVTDRSEKLRQLDREIAIREAELARLDHEKKVRTTPQC
jgi:integrase